MARLQPGVVRVVLLLCGIAPPDLRFLCPGRVHVHGGEKRPSGLRWTALCHGDVLSPAAPTWKMERGGVRSLMHIGDWNLGRDNGTIQNATVAQMNGWLVPDCQYALFGV